MLILLKIIILWGEMFTLYSSDGLIIYCVNFVEVNILVALIMWKDNSKFFLALKGLF